MTAPAWEVGQTVLHLMHGEEYNRRPARPTEVTVTKIGRTRLTVELYGRPKQFRIDTGYSVDDFGGRVVTPEVFADEARRRELRDALRDRYGLTTYGDATRHVSSDAWEAILAILDQETGHEA